MQFPSKTQFIEDISHTSEWNGDIFGVKKQELFFEKNYQSQDITEAGEPLPEGLWRNSHFIEEDSFNGSPEGLAFQHITSFEESIMENYGKKMKESFDKFLESTNRNFFPEENQNHFKKMKISDEEELEEAILSVSNLKEEIRKTLLSQSKKIVEAQQIIRNIIERLSEEHLVEALTICESIISLHQAANISTLDEDEIQIYIEEKQVENTKIIRGKLYDSWMVTKSMKEQKEFEKLVKSWMSTIFYAMNGVYGDESVKHSAEDLEAYQRPRKMVKLE